MTQAVCELCNLYSFDSKVLQKTCRLTVRRHPRTFSTEYPLVVSTRLRQSTRRGGTRQRRFDGTNFKPRKLLENAHAVPTGGSSTTALALFRGSGTRCVGRR